MVMKPFYVYYKNRQSVILIIHPQYIANKGKKSALSSQGAKSLVKYYHVLHKFLVGDKRALVDK